MQTAGYAWYVVLHPMRLDLWGWEEGLSPPSSLMALLMLPYNHLSLHLTAPPAEGFFVFVFSAGSLIALSVLWARLCAYGVPQER